LNARYLIACIGLLIFAVDAASGASTLIGDDKSRPESLTIAPGGVLIVGSASSPFVYRVRSGSSRAEKFIDVSAEGPGISFLGMLADAASNTLWACQRTVAPNSPPMQAKSALRGFDLSTGKPKFRWDLPGDNTACNDFSYGPDRALYITDTFSGKVYKLPNGAAVADLFLDHQVLRGVDGITFLNGTLYVNNVFTGKLYRIPVQADGKPGEPVEISTDQPLKGPDGMRAANGGLFIAENGGGVIVSLTVSGDKASVTVLKDGLKRPTGIEPAGDTLWFTEIDAGRADSIPMPR
jgi:hypothetical protein